jgi:hypothetical protein
VITKDGLPALFRRHYAGDEFRAVRITYQAARDQVKAAVLDAIHAEVPQREISELSGYTRENVGKIARSTGIEAKWP